MQGLIAVGLALVIGVIVIVVIGALAVLIDALSEPDDRLDAYDFSDTKNRD